MSLELSFQQIGSNGTAILRASFNGVQFHTDKVNLVSAPSRKRFSAEICKLRPGIDKTEVEAKLLGIEKELSSPPPEPPAQATELNMPRIVRPEVFHVAEVSGIAVPVVTIDANKSPVGRWELYLRWHNTKRRERRPLAASIELRDGERLTCDPLPSAPATSIKAGWSASARRNWLANSLPPDPTDVFQRMLDLIDCFIDFPPDSEDGDRQTLALWTMLTYVYPAWRAAPYLSLGGPAGSGKSTVFSVIAAMAFRPMQSSNMTAPCLFRSLHDMGGTLLLDEAERLRDGTPDAGDLRSILLSGYKAGSPARRLEKVGDRHVPVPYDVFGPKALACIGQLPEALASRCIRITMFRAGPGSEKPRRRIDEAEETWATLRDDLHALALEYGRDWIELSRRAEVVPEQMSGRDYELWQPLLALASWLEAKGVSGLTKLMCNHAIAVADAGKDDAVPETDEVLLRLLAQHVVNGTQIGLRAFDLLKEAVAQEPSLFSKWSWKGVSVALGRYGIKTRRTGGKSVYNDVTLRRLHRIEKTYGMSLDLPVEDVPIEDVPQRAQCAPNTEEEAQNGFPF